MIRILSFASLAFASASFLVGAAHAQTSDSATVSIGVNVEKAASPAITLSASRDAQFGTVYAPNGFTPDRRCAYNMGVGPSGAVLSVSERSISDNTFFSNNPIPTISGCEQSGSILEALISVNCYRDTPITFTWSSTSSNVQGITFSTGSASVYLASHSAGRAVLRHRNRHRDVRQRRQHADRSRRAPERRSICDRPKQCDRRYNHRQRELLSILN